MRALRVWVAARLCLVLLLVPLRRQLAEAAAELLTRLDYAHGLVKGLLIVWQSLLLRQDRVLLALAVAGLAALGLAILRNRAWQVGFVLAVAAVALVVWPFSAWMVALLAPLLLPNLLPTRTLEAAAPLAWIPGSELLAPGAVARAVGLPSPVARAAMVLGAVLGTGAWIVAESWISLYDYEKVLFAPWPDERVDPRVRTLERAPEGVKCDYHDIDVVRDRAVVVAEGSERLLNVARDGTITAWPLPRSWGRLFGLTMDSETDALSGQTWYLSGPRTVTGLLWDGGWTKVAETAPMNVDLHHTYMHWLRDREELIVFTIGTHNAQDPPLMIEIDTPGLASPKVRTLHLPDGTRPPTTRDLAWVPPLEAFVLAPDFGDQLLLARPGKATVEPWMRLPTLNGRLSWVGGLNRLLVPMPNQPELLIVDPVTASVERRFPTQPGVRAAAVDVARGLVLTASVLTGVVLVQRLDDATVVDHFGTVMPMARNLEVIPERGVALLSTWTALYCIPYAGSCG